MADMTAQSHPTPAESITGNAPEAPTNKDDALASDVALLRKLLLREHPEMQQRLREIANARPVGAQRDWDPRQGLGYWNQIVRLERDLDGAWTGAELDALVSDPVLLEQRISGERGIGLGFAAGRPGRGRRMADYVIEVVARSLALRAAGLPATRADEQAADDFNHRMRVRVQSIAIYRWRLRQRL